MPNLIDWLDDLTTMFAGYLHTVIVYFGREACRALYVASLSRERVDATYSILCVETHSELIKSTSLHLNTTITT